MKRNLFYMGAVLLLSVSCSSTNSSTKEETNNDRENEVNVSIKDISGQWYLENIVFNDSVNVRPSEEVPGSRQYLTFNLDSTYYIMTNCNAMSGAFTLHGDSITFSDGAMTELACDNMATEDALRKIIPHISVIDVENDSVMRLNSSVPSEYIVLLKAKEIK
ncbi:MAG: META domain-containing protein [Muribaculaceae bacterium]|nr:META domain-containing protein [Muribaculaceae bacterium]MDE6755499.1 META domain-containing protein [Muribaculaceae bacterium]